MTFLGPATVPIIVAALCTMLVLGVGGALTEVGAWYASLRRPSWQPPNWLFGPAWSAIGVCTAASAVLAWRAADLAGRREVVALFAINGVLNVGWSLLFFKLRRPDWALIEVVALWLSVAAPLVVIAPISALASALLAPYAIWVAFAAVLNRKIVQLNQPFFGSRHIVDLGS